MLDLLAACKVRYPECQVLASFWLFGQEMSLTRAASRHSAAIGRQTHSAASEHSSSTLQAQRRMSGSIG